ncbi:sulfatase family protein [Zobellia uliginosa]|uniref:sulfatase family protein n=1 Tax=Zobellia uliginosa TaxID=143224 RepID=UPI0026E48118|nr:sulfatase [Zobellia uliginosa]MDO6518693.1 sulfatase [Zobellia uliginosa]
MPNNFIRSIIPFFSHLLLAGILISSISCNETKKAAPSDKGAVQKPNVLILLTDQWRAQATGYAGDPNAITPNLDLLASESLNFENAVSGTPVCTPFRASLLTGQRPLSNGVFMNDVQLDTNALTMAKIFNKNHYDTGYIGKWHLDGHGRLQNVPPGARRQGFDFWKANECTHDYNHSVYYDNLDPEQKIWEHYDTFDQTDAALNYIQTKNGDSSPFMMIVSYGTPHAPYHTAPEKYRKMFDPKNIKLRENVPEKMQEKAKTDLAGYYAHIAAIDDMIGKITKKLKEEGQWENTLILFTSDHGDMLGSQGAYKKQQPYDESIRVPMLMKLPKDMNLAPAVKKTVINTEDILPTLLGLCDIDIPESIEGMNFSSIIKNNADDIDYAAEIRCIQPFGQWGRHRGGKEFRGLRTLRYTYTRDLNGPWLLYDNQTDPFQQNNLIGQAEFSAVQERLDKALAQRLNANNDAFLSGPEYIKKYGYHVDKNGMVPYTQ